MNLSALLLRLGFARQEDLGVNIPSVGTYFYFDGYTHAIDEDGATWMRKGRCDLGEFLCFSFDGDPDLWGSSLVVPHYGVKFAA